MVPGTVGRVVDPILRPHSTNLLRRQQRESREKGDSLAVLKDTRHCHPFLQALATCN